MSTLKQVSPARGDGSRWEWNDTKRQALLLLTEGGMTYHQTADALGITRETLWLWRKIPTFAEELADLQAALAAEVAQFAIGRKHERMSAKQRRWEALHRIVAERSEAMAGGDIAGGESGFIVRRYKAIGSGPSAYHVEEHEFDASLAKAFDALEKEASIEAGQRVEKQEVDSSLELHVGPPSVVRIHDQEDIEDTPNKIG